MTFTNASVDILVGNVVSKLVGAVPVERLDRALNSHLAVRSGGEGALRACDQPQILNPLDRSFLTGSMRSVKRLLRASGVRFRIRDLRFGGRAVHAWSVRGCALRGYQEEVVAAALRRGTGLIDCGTGAGKTLIAAAIIARLGRPTLYLVTTRTLLAQTRRELQRYLGIEPGVIGDGERRVEPLTVALVQALARQEEPAARWRDGVLVFDEGHHAAATSYFQLVRHVGARHNYFLSAAPYREAGDQVVLDALTGGSLTDGAYSARYLIDQGYACPVELRLETCAIRGKLTERPFWELYEEFIVGNEARNARIVAIAREHLGRGRSVLVLVDRIEHGRRILSAVGEGAAMVHGERGRAFLQREVARFAVGELKCLVATAGLFQEGVSIHGIHVLIQAGALKSRVKVLQSIGRGMRRAPGKDRCLYHDFFDDDATGIFRAHSLQRLRVLRGEGFHVPAAPRRPPLPGGDEIVGPAWSHVPGTRRFVRVDGEGRIHARALCLAREPVPDRLCKRCKHPSLCTEGGRITWRDRAGS
jgi:superfamily II DNA or RNA helicase